MSERGRESAKTSRAQHVDRLKYDEGCQTEKFELFLQDTFKVVKDFGKSPHKPRVCVTPMYHRWFHLFFDWRNVLSDLCRSVWIDPNWGNVGWSVQVEKFQQCQTVSVSSSVKTVASAKLDFWVCLFFPINSRKSSSAFPSLHVAVCRLTVRRGRGTACRGCNTGWALFSSQSVQPSQRISLPTGNKRLPALLPFC